MQAISETVDVIGNSVTIELPPGFPARRVQVIVLPAPEQGTAEPPPPHRPSPDLARTVIHDDLIGPAVSVDDWDAQA